MADHHKYGLAESISNAFDNPEHADVQVRCRGKTFLAHKVVLAGCSGYFASALKTTFKEGQEGIIRLSDEEDLPVIEAMLKFIYCVPDTMPPGPQKATLLAQLDTRADYYQMPALKRASKDAFRHLAESGTDGARWALAAAETIYQASEDDLGLRGILVKTASDNVKFTTVDNAECQALLEGTPRLLLEVARTHAYRPLSDQLWGSCSNCGLKFALLNYTDVRRTDLRGCDVSCPFCTAA